MISLLTQEEMMNRLTPTFPTQAKKRGISRGRPQKSPLQGGCGGLDDLASCGDPRSRLDGQIEVELLHEELLIGIELRVAAEDQRAPVRCGEVDIEHLDSSEFVEDGSRSEAARERPQPRPQGDVQAIGQERDEDVRLDAADQLMVDRPQLQIVLEVLKGGLDLDQLDIELPQLGRVPARQIGAQKISALAAPHLS